MGFPDFKQRKSQRLKGYDYSTPGYYFVTVCTRSPEYFFGKVVNRRMIINDAGGMINELLANLHEVFKNLKQNQYVIMPNHIHVIINISDVGTGLCACPFKGNDNTREATENRPYKISLSEIIGRFKSYSTQKYIENVELNNWHPFEGKLWQRSFYDHIVRTDLELKFIRNYIKNNPANWEKDEFYIEGL